MSDLYYQPFAPTSEAPARFCYPREMLVSEPIFPLYVLDGGAFHFAVDHFGAADSDTILKKTLDGTLFDEWRLDGVFDWERAFTQTKGTDFPKSYEWQIWPQRLYMIIPVAQEYLKSHDQRYADTWLTMVKKWDEAHPYQILDTKQSIMQSDFVWRDMQVAWRSLSLMHSVYMLADEKGSAFSEDEWKYIYDFIELHANHLYLEALHRLEIQYAQNHVLQIGTALIIAGTMFRTFKNADEYIRIGKQILEMNLRKAVFPDGGSDEDSPSYSHFIARLYLEGYLLLKNNGYDLFPGLEESIKAQYNHLFQLANGRGNTIQVSDSYTMDAYHDIGIADKLIHLDFPREKQSVLFPESQIAILRRGGLEVYADAMNVQGSHCHKGRPQTIAYMDGMPVLTDVGCISYDRRDMYTKVKASDSHNVFVADEIPDKTAVRVPEIITYDAEKGIVVTSCRVSNDTAEYKWLRSIELTDDGFDITDTVTASCPLHFRSYLHLGERATVVRPDAGSTTAWQLTDHYNFYFETDMPFEMTYKPATTTKNQLGYVPCLVRNIESSGFVMHTHIRCVKR